MRAFGKVTAGALALASLSTMLDIPADAAVVRRHLHCQAVSHVIAGITSNQIGSTVKITNNWSLTIPKGTVYSLRLAGHSSSFKSSKALGPGQIMNIAGPTLASVIVQCDVTIPG